MVFVLLYSLIEAAFEFHVVIKNPRCFAGAGNLKPVEVIDGAFAAILAFCAMSKMQRVAIWFSL